jgi:uncharacterized membrane protein YedE/YeeE
MFDTPAMIIGGLLTGLVFGFLLQKAHVTRYGVILGQFLFKDFTVLKVMLTAIVTGSIGVYAMYDLGMIQHLHIKTAALAAVALGGTIFGVGMALLGNCPGTGVAALGEGSRHAGVGVLGMVVGAGLYAETMPYFKDSLLKAADYGKVTFETISGISHWVFIGVLVMVTVAVCVSVEYFHQRTIARANAARSV